MTAGFTTVTYGSVSFFRCLTRSISQEPVYDESRTNVLYFKSIISISGQVNGRMLGPQADYGGFNSYEYTSVQRVGDTGQPLPAIDTLGMASLRHQQIRKIMGPRQKFTMRVGDPNGDGQGGTKLYEVSPAPAGMIPGDIFVGGDGPLPPTASNIALTGIDLDRGPKCLSFTVTAVTADETYSVDAVFEVCYTECTISTTADNNTWGILSNRWAWTDTMDSSLRTTRTYSGTLKFASANINPNHFRAMCLPPLTPMMRRDSISFAAAEDGLTLNWSVTDIEIAYSAPWPARTWRVTHAISQDAKEAFLGVNSIDVELTGDTNTSKSDLIDLAIYIITAKAFGVVPSNIGADLQDGIHTFDYWNQVIIKSLEFIDHIGDNVQISARAVIWTQPYVKGSKVVQENGQVTTNPLIVAADNIGRTFGAPLDATDVRIDAADDATRPAYNRIYSFGGYPGDDIEYEGPCISNLNIFLSYITSPCGNSHETASPDSGPNAPIQGRFTERNYGNLDDIDRNRKNTNVVDKIPPQNPPRVQINVFNHVNDTSVEPTYRSESQKISAYTKWQIENVYRSKTTKIQLPIARPVIQYQQQPGGLRPKYLGRNYTRTSSVVQLSGTQTKRILRIVGERIGEMPAFPNPESLPNMKNSYSDSMKIEGQTATDGGYSPLLECLDKRIRVYNPIQTLAGAMLYRAECQYILALSRDLNPGEQLDMGNDQWLSTVYSNTQFDQYGTPIQVDNNRLSDDNEQLTNTDWTKPPSPDAIIAINT